MGYTNDEIKQCNDCHYSEELWYYHEPRSMYIPGGNYHDPWFDYYCVPWWYESYWFYEEPGGPETHPLPRRSMRPGGVGDPTAPGSGASVTPGGDSNIKTDVKIDSKKKKKSDPPPPSKDTKRSPRPKKKKGDKEKDDG